MNEPIRSAGARHVAEIAANSRGLIEKALYMRCQSYLAHVKSQLLVKTIYEVDGQRRQLKQSNSRLAAALARVEQQREQLQAEVVRREQVERKLDRQREVAGILHRGLTRYLVGRELEAAFDLILGELMAVVGAAIAAVGDVRGAAAGVGICRVLVREGGELRPYGDDGPLDAATIEGLFGALDVDGRGTPGGGDAPLLPGLPATGDGVLLPIVRGPDALGVCVFAGLGRPAVEEDVALLDGVASSLGALLLADSLHRRELAQRQLAVKAKEEADAANHSKSRFLANMSHELRTPLNAITGMCYVLGQSPLEPGLRRHVERIESAGQTLLDLVDDVLDLSKIEADKLVLEARPFALEPVLRKALMIAETKAEVKGLELNFDRGHGLPTRVVGDRIRLLQVLTNLLDNAVKFTPEGRVSLRITADVAASTEARAALRFEVEDTGIGIDGERIADLFDPFAQADSTTTRRFGGTGLGLAICRRLAGLMGGSLTARSELGAGSTFCFEAPFPVAADERELGVSRRIDLRGIRVLVVEDNAMNQFVVEAILKSEGVEATVVDSGAAAIEAVARTDGFDAILMDVQMPGMDGYEATRRLRTLPKSSSTPILAMTAHVLPSDQRACLAAGMDDHLGKPIHVDALCSALALWTGRVGAKAPRPPQVADASPKGIDLEAAAAQLGGDGALLERVLSRFMRSYVDAGERLQRLLRSDDLAGARALLHDLRSVLGSIGAVELRCIAAGLHERLREEGVAVDAEISAQATDLADGLTALYAWLEASGRG
jgi:signal transduction histidine kinase/DNA-binding response OmpR family regulator